MSAKEFDNTSLMRTLFSSALLLSFAATLLAYVVGAKPYGLVVAAVAVVFWIVLETRPTS